MNSTLRGFALLGLAVGVVSAATGCGLVTRDSAAAARPHSVTRSATDVAARRSADASPLGSPTPTPGAASPSSSPLAPAASAYTGPHFGSPASAMIYLASAYNANDAAALHAVTTPQSYRELMQMRSEAVNLRLQHCALDHGRGDYVCYFMHDYPASLHQSGHGGSQMLIAPAQNPGWYLYGILGCG